MEPHQSWTCSRLYGATYVIVLYWQYIPPFPPSAKGVCRGRPWTNSFIGGADDMDGMGRFITRTEMPHSHATLYGGMGNFVAKPPARAASPRCSTSGSTSTATTFTYRPGQFFVSAINGPTAAEVFGSSKLEGAERGETGTRRCRPAVFGPVRRDLGRRRGVGDARYRG